MKQISIYLLTIMALFSTIFAKEFSYELSPYIGKNFMDKNYRMSDSTVVGLNFDTYLLNNYGLRLGYERLLNMKVDHSDDAIINRFYINAIGKYKIKNSILAPYVFGGFGHESCEDNDCPSAWFRNLGIGLSIDVARNFQISPELKVVNRDRSCGIGCDNLTDYVATIGGTYLFGQPKVINKIQKIRVAVPVEKIVTKEIRVEVPVEVIPENTCTVPLNIKDRCDNSYYVQVASFTTCPTCKPKIKDKRLLNKINAIGYRYELYKTTSRGNRVLKVLIGPYRCKRDAYSELCYIKREFKCDAFIYSKTPR